MSTQQSANVTAGNDAKATDYNKAVTDIGVLFESVGLWGVGSGISGTPPTAQLNNFLMQTGTRVIISNVNGDFTIPFPVSFPNGLISVVICGGNAQTSNITVGVWDTGNNAGGFNGHCNVPNSTLRVNWIAIGW